jgi:hypothetical protein
MLGAFSFPRIDHEEFHSFVRSKPVVIIEVRDGMPAASLVSWDVALFFTVEYKNAFAFGIVDSSTARFPCWFPQHVRKAISGSASDGFYLFVNGAATAFHSETIDSLGWEIALAGLWVLGAAARHEQTVASANRSRDRMRAAAVIQFFQAALATRKPQLPSRAVSAAPPSAVAAAYSFLGVSPAADHAEVKSAYRHQLRQFHPDLNGNVTDGTRQLLDERTRKVVEAYGVICRHRRWSA